ncbi:hypothetical protein BDW22DRAFT_1328402 [Trametopsis cervina]|nr:hypothetical protein BDW22DRAFT_1328402 [Trametopsis cervina]
MSDSAHKKHLFVLYAPDHTDADAPSRRLAVRPKHIEAGKQLYADGVHRLGGAMISPDTYQTDSKKMVGSFLIFEAESIEAVREIVEKDVYWTGNVWDKEKLAIIPFVAAHPFPPASA